VTNEEVLVLANEARSVLKTICHGKHRWLGHILRHENILRDIIEGEMMGKTTLGRKRIELLHNVVEGRDCGQLKDVISDRSRRRQDSKRESVLETCWKQQKTKEE